VVLLHGYGGDKDNWTRLAKHLPERLGLFSPDLPGFGKSSRHMAAFYDVESQLRRLDLIFGQRKLKRFHLVGNSMGGQIAAAYAATRPQKVISLILLAPAGVATPKPSEVALARQKGKNILTVDSVEDFDRLLNLVFVVPPEIPTFIKSYLAEEAVKNRAFNEKVLVDREKRPYRLENRLADIEAPTLLIWGDTDRVLDHSGAQIFSVNIPHSDLVTMRDCGHMPMVERPQETAKYIMTFLDGLRSSTQ